MSHNRQFAGLRPLIMGSPAVPLFAAKAEQAIAQASPEHEVATESFEDLPDAIDFAKSKKDVGIVFLHEKQGKYRPADVFRELCRPFESRGWQGFGLLVHAGEETLEGLRTVKQHPNLLMYVSENELLEPLKAKQVLDEFWRRFCSAFEQNVIPSALQSTLLSIAEKSVDAASAQFLDRASRAIYSNLDVSWLDTVAIRWAPIVSAVQAASPEALRPHTAILDICKSASGALFSSVEECAGSKAELSKRVLGTAELLNRSRLDGKLAETLSEFSARSKPGAPAITRYIANHRDDLLEIAHECERAQPMEATG